MLQATCVCTRIAIGVHADAHTRTHTRASPSTGRLAYAAAHTYAYKHTHSRECTRSGRVPTVSFRAHVLTYTDTRTRNLARVYTLTHTYVGTPHCTHFCTCTLAICTHTRSHSIHAYANTRARTYIHSHAHARTHVQPTLSSDTAPRAVGGATQDFTSPFTETVDCAPTSPCWSPALWKRFLMSL